MSDFFKKNFLVLSAAFSASATIFFLVFFVAPAFKGEKVIPESLDFGFFQLRFYSLMILSGILAAFWANRKFFSESSLKISDWENLIILAFVSGLVGARIHHVLSLWPYYQANPADILKIWQGGLGFFGGVAGAACAVFVFSRFKKISFLHLADRLALALPLAHAIGRWGNFFNQEAFGIPTDLPWKMYVAFEKRPVTYLGSDFFHPTFLYESLWNLLIFFILRTAARRGFLKNEGGILGAYLIFYGIGRFFIESLRVDVWYIWNAPANQIFSLFAVAAGATLLSLMAFPRSSKKN